MYTSSVRHWPRAMGRTYSRQKLLRFPQRSKPLLGHEISSTSERSPYIYRGSSLGSLVESKLASLTGRLPHGLAPVPPGAGDAGGPVPPLAGRVRPNSERVPRPWRDGFAPPLRGEGRKPVPPGAGDASRQGRGTRPPSDFCRFARTSVLATSPAIRD